MEFITQSAVDILRLSVLKYSRESSDYIYGPGDIGGGNPIVFPDQEDFDVEDEYEVVRQGRMTNP